MVKKNDSKKYVVRKTVKGRPYWYFRRAGKYIRLPDDPDSPEFDAAYWEIRSGKHAKQTTTTFDTLVAASYQSPQFKKLGKRTKQEYRRTRELIREKNGPKDFTLLRRRDVIAARDTYADTWRKANAIIEQLSLLAELAIDLEWITVNPARGVKKLKGGEYEPWPDPLQQAYVRYCERHGLDTELLVYFLCVGTGQRIGDVVTMKWSHFDGDYMKVVQEKTGSRIWIYCPERLKNHLQAVDRKGKYILAKNLNEPISKRRIQALVQDVRGKVGAMAYVIHGWRYTAAVELAEAGCSDAEIMAVTGHKTAAMAQKYRAQANQKKLSKSAQERRK